MKQHLTGYSLIHDMQLDGRHALSEFHTHAFDLFSKAVLYPSFPCVGAKQVLHQNAVAFVAAPMPMTHNEAGEYLCRCLYRWSEDIDYPQYQVNSAMKFITMIIVFPEMNFVDETEAEELLWQLLGRVHEHDRMHYDWTAESTRCVYDDRFSMSIGGYAHFIPFFSPVASTMPRWFPYPTLVLNPHFMFEKLRQSGRFENIRKIIRGRAEHLQEGWHNPKLADHGLSHYLEAPQYALTLNPSFYIGLCPFTGKPRPGMMPTYDMTGYPFSDQAVLRSNFWRMVR